MPTYGYQCTECQYEFQAFQTMKEAPLTTCPKCNGPVKRLLYPVGIIFKGSGWYITDSRKQENTSSDGKTKKEDTTPESKSNDSTL
ncbi:MAG TPA: FmdB family zinc ribbon protein [Chthonomonas sp.]|uniref:FmdB family zinc ribbon protein n=1 Tax=Chthonomonas sp. TaxID=2282153 RepID=UPI002B4AD50B|nr:FmdB family zinc ribbon protein [Chthonomonas sp.]HLI48795.1 FmdB family zinc ribbon protein [Chthonomonas sp.]